jgi:hypothetical protein
VATHINQQSVGRQISRFLNQNSSILGLGLEKTKLDQCNVFFCGPKVDGTDGHS